MRNYWNNINDYRKKYYKSYPSPLKEKLQGEENVEIVFKSIHPSVDQILFCTALIQKNRTKRGLNTQAAQSFSEGNTRH